MTPDKVELSKWYAARNVLLGQHGAKVDFGRGLQMAKHCQHEDAKWLVALIHSPMTTAEEARDIFLDLSEDARGVFWSLYVRTQGEDATMVQQAAKMGYAPTQAMMAVWSKGGKHARWAEMAAAQHDPSGLYCLALCKWNGDGCEKNEDKALLLFKEAAELGSHFAQGCYGEFAFTDSQWERYAWWERAAVNGF